ncbi:MAG: hypothetical protein IJY14_02920 [Acholeplasmatales bacterium]|nr:hypothetical protein [Acholeplasmatales bacterium]
MANVKVQIKVTTSANVNELYLVGNTSNLGEWNAENAVKLTYCDECKAYFTNKMLPAGEQVEFKVLAGKDWAFVEKGGYGEEVSNHVFTVEKGQVVEVVAYSFAN